ncbi:MAG: Gfo/Idh/MocA family oxidoreductase [Candidatus Eisenbacteria bacterium]|nr:Gfo/Idh/MocA family oxidoreductase [Candidatus Eisenbacteria bacterium]
MSILKTGVVGVGHLGAQHARVLSRIPGSELKGIVDLDLRKTEKLNAELNLKPFSSLQDLLSAVDAVSIAVPTSEHHSVAEKCIGRGIHVFIEKPIAKTVSEAEELVLLAKEKGLVIQVGHVERYNPAVIAARPFIRSPKFIEAHRLARFTPRSLDIDVILDLMIHDIDVVLSFVKSKIKRIDAVGVSILSEKEDIANARILFENGAVANLTASRVSREKMRKIRFFQPSSYVSLDCLVGEAEIYELTGKPSLDEAMSGTGIESFISGRKIKGTGPDALTREFEDFVTSVLESREPLVTGRDGLEALKVAVEVGKEVKTSLKKVMGGLSWNQQSS